MKKLCKTIAKAAIGAGAAYLISGEVLYEGVINIKFNKLLREKTPFFTNEEEEAFWESCEPNIAGKVWFDEQAAADTILWSYRLRKNTYAKVFFNEEKTDNWAIVCHGYTSCPRDMGSYALRYLGMGFNVILVNMIGHCSDNTCYTSMGHYDKYVVLDWVDYIISLNKNAKIVIHGVSMGSATTMLATGEDLPDNVISAVADCGYTSCWEEYCSQIGPMFHLPPFPLIYAANTVSKLRGNFDFKETAPIKAVVHSKTPTLFIHGEQDTFVPYSMMVPLYEACGAPYKEMLSVPNAFHATSSYFEPEMYWNKVKEFVGRYTDVK